MPALANHRAKEEFRAEEGEAAVRASREVSALKAGEGLYDQGYVDADGEREIKRVGNTTFYKMEGVWVDARYKEGMKILKVKFGSNAYFQICRRAPALKRLLAVGDRVVVVWKGKCIEVGLACA